VLHGQRHGTSGCSSDMTTIHTSQMFRGVIPGNTFMLLGVFWQTLVQIEGQIKARGGRVLKGAFAPGAAAYELHNTYLLLGTNVITPKDSIGYEYELRAEVSDIVKTQILGWVEDYGMRILAERDMREAFEGESSLSRFRADRIDARMNNDIQRKNDDAREHSGLFAGVIEILDDVIDGDEKGTT